MDIAVICRVITAKLWSGVTDLAGANPFRRPHDAREQPQRIRTAAVGQAAALHFIGQRFGLPGDDLGSPPQRLLRERQLKVIG